MFAYKDKTDKYGITHRNYFLTQGDTFTLVGNVPDDQVDAVKGVKFQIGANEVVMYSQRYTKVDNKYYCVVPTEETTKWEITGDNEPYDYEIVVTLADGNEKTVMKANFTIWEQMKEA